MKIYAKTLIKTDRNGSKHYEGIVTCDRCGGAGGAENWKYTGWTCYKCNGTGKMKAKWIERTPEYEAKLEARRAKKAEANRAEAEARKERYEAAIKAAEEAKKAREAEEAAKKAISQYVGAVGAKLDIKARFDHTAWYERKSFAGYGMETVYIVSFRDADGNLLIWKTTSPKGCNELEEGDEISLKGTVKEHTEYKDEKQTILTRCRVTK